MKILTERKFKEKIAIEREKIKKEAMERDLYLSLEKRVTELQERVRSLEIEMRTTHSVSNTPMNTPVKTLDPQWIPCPEPMCYTTAYAEKNNGTS